LRHGPDHKKGGDNDNLRQRVIGGIDSEQPVDDRDQPPRQWRQLVVAKLPLVPVGERLDQVE
jgi:hypothetical protein